MLTTYYPLVYCHHSLSLKEVTFLLKSSLPLYCLWDKSQTRRHYLKSFISQSYPSLIFYMIYSRSFSVSFLSRSWSFKVRLWLYWPFLPSMSLLIILWAGSPPQRFSFREHCAPTVHCWYCQWAPTVCWALVLVLGGQHEQRQCRVDRCVPVHLCVCLHLVGRQCLLWSSFPY